VSLALQALGLFGLLAVFIGAVFLPDWGAFAAIAGYVAIILVLRLILGGRDEDRNLE